MLGSLEEVPGDAAISDLSVVVFWFGVLLFFLPNSAEEVLAPSS